MTERIAVIGLGYVGLPVATAFARKFPDTIGFDVDQRRVRELREGYDRTGELSREELEDVRLAVTAGPDDLRGTTLFIVTVPTPIDGNRQPDLGPLSRACEIIAPVLRPGGVVVVESTVYPGVTEEFCGPLLARVSRLRQGIDFTLGYSPERINPGDREHRLETIVKVVSASDAETLGRVARAYGAIVPAGIHCAPSIRVAEAAKVIENTQRDLNIALMNELALIFDRLGIRTKDVLEAAQTKWNFLPFTPGLVGGHCIGVDPYYLTAKAESVGYNPEVILAGRRINDGMGVFVARKLVKMLIRAEVPVHRARVGILGVTFKENVPDLRNSRVVDIVRELREFGVEARVHDPLADPQEAEVQYGLNLAPLELFERLDAVVLAVPHAAYLDGELSQLAEMLEPPGIIMDLKSALEPGMLPPHATYWSL